MVSSHTNNKHKCYICGHNFKTEMKMKDHIAIFHNNDNAEATCSECNFEAKTPGEQKHLKDSTEDKKRGARRRISIFMQ